MRRTLLATTAMLATTFAAQAEIGLSGSAQMGIFSGSLTIGNFVDYEAQTQFLTDLDITFTLAGETDGGIRFGASVDLDEARAIQRDSEDPVAIFISSDIATFTMGDTDSAFDFAMVEVSSVLNPGSLNDDETTHFAHRGSYLDGFRDGQIARLDIPFGDFTFSGSVELADREPGETAFSFGLRYDRDYGNVAVSLGAGFTRLTEGTEQFLTFQRRGFGPILVYEDPTEFGVSASVIWDVDMGPIDSLGIGLQGSGLDSLRNLVDHWHHGIGLGMTAGAFSLHGNYGVYEMTTRFRGTEFPYADLEGYGISAGYDLGGGLRILGAYGYSEFERPGSVQVVVTESFSFGLDMAF